MPCRSLLVRIRQLGALPSRHNPCRSRAARGRRRCGMPTAAGANAKPIALGTSTPASPRTHKECAWPTPMPATAIASGPAARRVVPSCRSTELSAGPGGGTQLTNFDALDWATTPHRRQKSMRKIPGEKSCAFLLLRFGISSELPSFSSWSRRLRRAAAPEIFTGLVKGVAVGGYDRDCLFRRPQGGARRSRHYFFLEGHDVVFRERRAQRCLQSRS